MSTYPPDDWSVGPNAWNTDVELDTATFLSSDASVKFKSTTPASNPYSITTKYYPVVGGRGYVFEALWQADSNAVGNYVWAEIVFYTDALAVISTSSSGTRVNATSTWEAIRVMANAPATARYARPQISKTNTAFNGWVDSVRFFTAKPELQATVDATTLAAGGWTKVAMSGSVAVGGTWSDANDRFTLTEACNLTLGATVKISSVADGKQMAVAIYKNGAIREELYRGSTGAAGDITIGGVVAQSLCTAGDYFEVFVYNGDSVDRDTDANYGMFWATATQN